MTDDRAAQTTAGPGEPILSFRPPPILTPSMAIVAVVLPAFGFLAAANLTPDFAEPLFRKFFAGYLALVTSLVVGGMALWRVYLRRKGIPPIRFTAASVQVPLGAVSPRSVALPYDEILSAAAMNTLRGPALVLDARRRAYIFPASAFADASAVATFQRELRSCVLRQDGGATRWAAMATRAEIAQRFGARRPWATWITLAVIAAVFLVQLITIPATDPISIVDLGANAAALIRDGQWFRLITANLLHVNTLHLVSNAVLVWVVGALVERQLGTLRFIVLALASGLASQFVSSLAAQIQANGALSVGISGVVFGMLGAQAVLDRRFRTQLPGFYRLAPVLWWAVLILNFVILPLVARAPDNAAHAGGLAMGLLLGWVFSRRQQDIADHAPSTPGSRIAIATLSILWVLGIATAGIHGASVIARAADRGLLAGFALVYGTPNAATDQALARAIALAPGGEPKMLEVALVLAERAQATQGNNRRRFRRSAELIDTLSVLHYRLGHLETAIDLQASLMRLGTTQFAGHLTRFLEDYHHANGVRILGDGRMQTRAISVTRLPSSDGLSLDVGPGDPLPQGARIYALVHRDTQLLGVLEVDVAPRNETGTQMPRRAPGPLPPMMAALADGATISVAQFDSRGCRCYADRAEYTEYREDTGLWGNLVDNSVP